MCEQYSEVSINSEGLISLDMSVETAVCLRVMW